MAKVFNLTIRSVKDFEESYLGLSKWEERERKAKIEEEIRKAPEVVAMARRYPLIELTQQEYDILPKAGDFSVEWLRNEAPFDFKFICGKSEPVKKLAPDLITMGHLVKGVEAICNQYGAVLSVPEKFINRYGVRIES